MGVRFISLQGLEPVTLTEAKLHLRVDGIEEDAIITTLIRAAREYAEGLLGRALVESLYEWTVYAWPLGRLDVPYPPLTLVESIMIIDGNGASTVWPSDQYLVVNDTTPGYILPRHHTTWPALSFYPGRVVVRYRAGYSVSTLPAPLRQAMLLLIGQWYAHREAAAGTIKELPLAVNALLAPYRMYRWSL